MEGRTHPPTGLYLFGKVRDVKSITKLEWTFLGVNLASNLVALIVSLFRVSIFIRKDSTTENTTNIRLVIMLAINILFSIFYSFNGVFRERKFELYALAFSVMVVLAYVLLHYIIPNRSELFFNLIRLVSCATLAPVIIGLSIYIPRTFGKFVFLTIGAIQSKITAYRILDSFNSLLNLDLQLTLNSLVLMYDLSSQDRLFALLSLGLGLLMSFAIFIFGFLAIRLERTIFAYLLWALSFFEFIYLIYTAVVFYGSPGKQLIYISFITIIASALLFRIVLVVHAIFAIRSFGLGVRDILFGDVGKTGYSIEDDTNSYDTSIET